MAPAFKTTVKKLESLVLQRTVSYRFTNDAQKLFQESHKLAVVIPAFTLQGTTTYRLTNEGDKPLEESLR